MMTSSKIKLFISSDLTDKSLLPNFCLERGWELTAHSLLEFAPLSFKVSRDFDVVFFSSPRSYNYFYNYFLIPDKTVLATVGKGTASIINDKNNSIDFIGEKSGNPEQVAEDFARWLGSRNVLFPLAKQSQETIAQRIPDNQKEIVRVYETKLKSSLIELHDIYVFTSPSNVESFLRLNQISIDSKLVAWGKTTEKKLVDLGYLVDFVLQESTEHDLINYLKSM